MYCLLFFHFVCMRVCENKGKEITKDRRHDYYVVYDINLLVERTNEGKYMVLKKNY